MKKSSILLLSLFFICGFTFGQEMSTPVRVYDSPLNASKEAQVAFGPDGKVHIVWEEDYYDSGGSDIFYMAYDGETWEGPVKLKDSRNINSREPYICTTQAGGVYVVWSQENQVYVRYYDPDSETWLPDERVSTADYGSTEPCCAADPDGNVYISWHDPDGGRAFSRAKIDGQWEAIHRLSGQYRSTQQSIAAGKDGQVWAIWRWKTANGEYKIQYSRRTKDIDWRGEKDVNYGGASQTHPHLAVGPDNVPVVTYADIDEHENIEIWISTIDEQQNPRERVEPSGLMHYSRVAVDSLGNVHVAWQIGPGDNGQGIRYTNNINRPDGQWKNPILFDHSGGGPKLPGIAADDYENVAVVWASFGAGEKNIWFSSLYPVTIAPPPLPPPPPPPPTPDPPVNLGMDISITSIIEDPSITYNLSWEKNPANTDENVSKYNIYKKENDGEYELLISLTPAIYSAVFSFQTLNNRIHFGISTVYLFESDDVYADGETESEIVFFGINNDY